MCSRVVLPYTRIEDGVLEALVSLDVDAELRDVSGDDEAYWRLLSELWERAEDFIVIEQDVVIEHGTLRSFENCSNGWCGAGYEYLGSRNYVGLGCTRFRREFIETFPDLMEVAGRYTDEAHAPRHWCSLDAAIQFALRDRDQHVCSAHGTVEHLGDGRPSHMCC